MLKKRLYNALRTCADPVILFVTLPYLMALTILGTVAQAWLGLYGALDEYFYSFMFFLGPLPLPGGASILAVFFINLLARFIGYSRWTWDKAGIHLSHFGVLLLLIGGLISALTRVDTVLPLAEGEMSSFSQSYTDSRFVITKNGAEHMSIPFTDIAAGQNITVDDISISILNTCLNCRIELRPPEAAEGWQGPAASMMLTPDAEELDAEANLTGVNFAINDTEKHLTFIGFPKPPTFQTNGDVYTFAVLRVPTPLPFSVALTDVRTTYHPGTARPKAYESDLVVTDNGEAFPVRIEMNKPFFYKGHTLFQSGVITDFDGTEKTVLAVVYNTGRFFPYIACVILTLGLMLHLLISIGKRLPKGTEKAAILLCGLMAIPSQAIAAEISVSNEFRMLPILHEGRIKPIESFAGQTLRQITGDDTLSYSKASDMMGRIIFDPTSALSDPLFSISSPSLRRQLGLSPDASVDTSFVDISAALDKTRDRFLYALEVQENGQELTQDQIDLIDIHARALTYLQLIRSFSFVMPLAQISQTGDGSDLPVTFKDLQKESGVLQENLDALLDNGEVNINDLNEDELSTLFANYQLNVIETAGRGNIMLRVIPAQSGEWVAPWQVLTQGQAGPNARDYMSGWTQLMVAYQLSDQARFDDVSINLLQSYDEKSEASKPLLKKEILYNRLAPVKWAVVLAMLSALMLSLPRTGEILKRVSLITALGATGLCMMDLITRSILLSRPPVGTLYESMIFVAAILAIGVCMLMTKTKNTAIGIIGMGAVALILGASFYLPQTGDDLSVLDAVLNTNFWLATHVLIITTGYAWCVLASALAHITLFTTPLYNKKWKAVETDPIIALTHKHGLIALMLVTVGTILGGIWADASWGRFWGWDPKENGALLIALWLIWIVHAKYSEHLSPLTYIALMAGVTVPVALAWFGVNLLGIGLHSYGFIAGVAGALIGFCIAQMCVIIALTYKNIRGTDAA